MRIVLKSLAVSQWCSTWVKTSMILESDLRLFLKCGIIQNFISPMVTPGNVRIFTVFCFDILYCLMPDRIESPIIRVFLFPTNSFDCCDFVNNCQHTSQKRLVQDSIPHLR